MTSSRKKAIIITASVAGGIAVLAATAFFATLHALIGKDEAEYIALRNAGLAEADVTGLHTDLTFDDGHFQYEVGFYANGTEYDYDIKAGNGEILRRDIDGGTFTTNASLELEPLTEEDREALAAAKETALQDAGVSAEDVTFTKEKMEIDHGREVFDLEFHTGDTQYDYEISAEDGSILEKSQEAYNGNAADPSLPVTVDMAKETALQDAGVAAADVTFQKAKLERENGRQIYDIEFSTDTTRYDYEISAEDGSILEKSVKQISASSSTEVNITLEQARQTALDDAGLTASDVTIRKERQESENGRPVYDIEFTTDTAVYDYEISAADGSILEKSVKQLSTGSSSSAPSTPDTGAQSMITAEQARSAALQDAGLSASEVTFHATRLDTDNGVRVYDVEFYTATTEYDYEINAQDGSVVEKSSEPRGNSAPSGTPNDSTPSGTPGTGGDTATTSITAEQAKEIALRDAGLSASDVTFHTTRLENDHGVRVYDIEFYTATTEYDYEISAQDGSIIEKSSEPRRGSSKPTQPSQPSTPSVSVTLEQAKNLALQNAGVSAADAQFTKAQQDYEHGVTVYDIEFYTATTKYEYEISAQDGSILEKKSEARKTPSKPSQPSTPSVSVTLEQAKNLALQNAGLSAGDVQFTKTKQDYDHGMTVYDIEFYSSDTEYEYEISAQDGSILEKKTEPRKGSNGGSSSTPITVDEAKNIALKHAGLTLGDVNFKKAKQERDDGRIIYEIEFYYGRMEYSYEIDATTGAILDFEIDDD